MSQILQEDDLVIKGEAIIAAAGVNSTHGMKQGEWSR